MKKELDEALCRDFPLLYRDRHADMRVTCMCWGFPGDGWEPLIRTLSEQLEKMIADGNWLKDAPCAAQVKEKYGGLRFYMTTATDEMFDLIETAEEESYHVCERCGRPGENKADHGWYRTECDGCAEARKGRNKKYYEQEPRA